MEQPNGASATPSSTTSSSTTTPTTSQEAPQPLKTEMVKGQPVIVHKKDMNWTEEEQKRLEDHLVGPSSKKQEVNLISETGQTREVRRPEIKAKATVFFKNCKDCHFTIGTACTKVLIESCVGCTFTFNSQIKTEVLEIWRCENATLRVNTPIKTLQADIIKGLNISYKNRDMYQAIIWGGVHDLALTVGEGDAAHSVKTGFNEMKAVHADQELSEQTDQWFIRFINDKLTIEQVVRLKNGYPTTEREAKEFDEKQQQNEEAREKYMRDLIKFAAPRLGLKDDRKRPKGIGRNDPCPCKSGKKFKVCCWNKYEN